MHFFIPIKMQTLNTHIKEKLILTNLYATIRKIDNNGFLELCGGNLTAGKSSRIRLTGVLAGFGETIVYTPDAAELNDVIGFRVSAGDHGSKNIDCYTNHLIRIADPTTAQDAVSHHDYAAWAPNLTWATANPAAVTTVARYVQIGKTVFFSVDVRSADSNATTGLSFTLPIAPKNNAKANVFTAYQLNSATHYASAGLNSDANSDVAVLPFQVGIDGAQIRIYCSGHYEVA